MHAVHACRYHELAGCVGIEGQRTDRDRARSREADRIVGVDRSQHRGRIGRRDAGRDPRRHQASAVVQPREPVGIETAQRVIRKRDFARDCAEASRHGGGGHARVPVSSSTEPPVSVVWRTSRNPAARRRSSSSGIGGRYAVLFGR